MAKALTKLEAAIVLELKAKNEVLPTWYFAGTISGTIKEILKALISLRDKGLIESVDQRGNNETTWKLVKGAL